MIAMPLVEMLTGVSLLLPVLPWEMCALRLIEKFRPSSVTLSCISVDDCPSNSFYKMVPTTTETIVGAETHELPPMNPFDMVFIVNTNDYVLWGNETIQKYRTDGRNAFKVVVVASLSENHDRDLVFMGNLFEAMRVSGVLSSVVLLANATSTELFTYFPYRNGSCNETTPVMLGTCSNVPNTTFDGVSKVRNLNKCSIHVSLTDDRPYASYPSSGRMIEMVNEISRQMNFTIAPIAPVSGRQGGHCGPEEHVGIRGDVFTGRADMGVAAFMEAPCSRLEYIGLQYPLCFAWCTPVMSGSDYIFLVLIRPLALKVWLALLVSTVMVILSVNFIYGLVQDNEPHIGAMDVFVFIFAGVPIKSRSTPLRSVLGIWILSCLVIRSAYEGELKSQSSVPLGSRWIETLEELAEEGILLCTSLTGLKLLNQEKAPLAQMIFKKSKICDGSLYENMVLASKVRDRAVFTTDLRCSIASSDISEESTLYSNTGGCFLWYQLSMMITMRGSPYKAEWKMLQQRFIEAGLVNKWMNVKPMSRVKGQVAAYSLIHLVPALFVLGIGWSSGCAIFLAESVCYKCSLKKKWKMKFWTLQN